MGQATAELYSAKISKGQRLVSGFRLLNHFLHDFAGAPPSRFGILREEGIRAGINANRRLYSRRAPPFIPAGLSLYSRRAGAGAPGMQLLPGLRRRPRAGAELSGHW